MLKKILKGYIISVLLFAILTLLAAAVLRFTSLSENMGFYMILVAMCATCLTFGISVGNAIGKKGLVAGIAAALLMLVSIIGITLLCFRSEPCADMLKFLYFIPVVAGAIGGICGANLSKT